VKRATGWLLAGALACRGDVDPADPATPRDTDPPGPAATTPLDPAAGLARASMALRGVRPTPDELRAVVADPTLTAGYIDAWLRDPRFAATVQDLYADVLFVRSPDATLPQLGPHLRTPRKQLQDAVANEPLRLIERVVTDDLPFTTVVTADWTVLDATGASLWRGHGYDPEGADVQQVPHTDGRPAAGLLTTNGLWVRHASMGANYNRGRANAVSRALLCVDHLDRDVPIDGSVDLTDDDAVADAVDTNPACVSCHQSLDPIASTLWPIFPQIDVGAVGLAYLSGCVGPLGDLCYPARLWTPELTGAWRLLRTRPPGLSGQPVDDLGGLGAAIAADPRFATCAADRFWSYLTQTPLDEVPFEVSAELTTTFLDAGLSARALAQAVVTHPRFLARAAERPEIDADLPGPLIARPEQLGRMVEALTGFQWTQSVDGPECTLLDLNCYGDVELTTDDVYGFRAMAGGVDGASVLVPVHHPTPVQQLALTALAEDAAGFLMRTELDLPAADRRLLRLVEADTTDEIAIRAQLADLHLTVLSEVVDPAGAEVDATWQLWQAVHARSTPRRAWTATLAALLQAPQAWMY
jgi:hypothetical protein